MSTAGACNNIADDQLEGEEEGPINPRRCAASKYLRRRCAHDCTLAHYFPASQARRYACVHRVFGASKVARLLKSFPEEERGHAAEAMAVEAQWRVHDPVYGCTGRINWLQEEISAVQYELASTLTQLAILDMRGTRHRRQSPAPPPPLLQQHHSVVDDMQMQREVEQEAPAPLLDPDDFLDLDGF